VQTSAGQRGNPTFEGFRPGKEGDTLVPVDGRWPHDAVSIVGFYAGTGIGLASASGPHMLVLERATHESRPIYVEEWDRWRRVSDYEKLNAPWYETTVMLAGERFTVVPPTQHFRAWTQGEPIGWGMSDQAPEIRVRFDAAELPKVIEFLNRLEGAMMNWDDADDALAMRLAHLLSGHYWGFNWFYAPWREVVTLAQWSGARLQKLRQEWLLDDPIFTWRSEIDHHDLTMDRLLTDLESVRGEDTGWSIITRHKEEVIVPPGRREVSVWGAGNEDTRRWVSVEQSRAGLQRAEERRKRLRLLEEIRDRWGERPADLPPGAEWPQYFGPRPDDYPDDLPWPPPREMF
jgi:hypothetical protein